jgi:hypothetical protein
VAARGASSKVALSAALLLGACGYHPLYGGEAAERLGVVGTTPLVADASVVAEVEAGVRAGLARAGGLREGKGYPRAVVEVLRIDAASEGIAETSGLGATPGTTGPLARGTRIGILGRAWVERGPDMPKERDTGDVRTVEVMAVEGDARLEALRLDDASRAAARRLGQRLARRLLGEPDAPDDGM